MVKRNYGTLDALRGIAALIVVTRHASEYFRYGMFPESFLAVDLFFVLSGFVVADAYEGRLAAGGYFWNFIKTRLIRLYPLYFLGLVLAILFRAGSVRHGEDGWTTRVLGQDALLGLLMMGAALNGPMWTLLPEMASNAFYGATLRWLNKWTLVAIAGVGLVGIIAAEITYGNLDTGYSLKTTWVSISRVAFSFFVGVFIRHETRTRGRHFSRLMPVISCVVLAAVLLAPVSAKFRAPYELAMVAAGFPLLVWIAVHFEPIGALARIGTFLGLTSYAIYTIHQPLSRLSSRWIGHLFHIQTTKQGWLAGALFMILVIGAAAAADALYDQPIRRWLSKKLLSKGRADPPNSNAESLARVA